jgi:hypothetical protein
MSEALIIHNSNSSELYELKDLHPLQGDYKKLTKVNLLKLTKSFDIHGFSFPVKIWTDEKGIHWIIAGHQRLRVLKNYKSCIVVNYTNSDEGLIEISRDSYDKIMIPCELVRADNRVEAIKLLLLEDSRFGTTNVDSNFFKDEGLTIADFEDFSIQDLDLKELSADINDIDLDTQLKEAMNGFSNENTVEENEEKSYTADLTKPRAGEMLNEEAKMQHAIGVVNLTFTIPQVHAEELETKLSQVPLIITGKEREQNLRGRRLIKLLLDIDYKPL